MRATPRQHFLPSGQAVLERVILRQETITVSAMGKTTTSPDIFWQETVARRRGPTPHPIQPGDVWQAWRHDITGETVTVVLQKVYPPSPTDNPFVSSEYFMRVCHTDKNGALLFEDSLWTDKECQQRIEKKHLSDAQGWWHDPKHQPLH